MTPPSLPTELSAAAFREHFGLEPNSFICDRFTSSDGVWEMYFRLRMNPLAAMPDVEVNVQEGPE